MSLKTFGRQSLIYGFGHILARLVTFLLLPLYTNIFSTEEYGVISLAYAFIGFANILFHYGMDTALMKFYITENEEEKIDVFSTVWILQLCTSFIFAFFMVWLSPFISKIILGESATLYILKFIAIILALDVLWKIPMLLLRAEERSTQFVLFNLFNVLATIAFNYYFVVKIDLGITGVFIGNILASIMMVFFLAPFIFKRVNLKKLSPKLLKKIMKFGLPFVPAGIFTMIMELADRYLLEWMVGTSSVGLYSAGYKLGMFGLLLVMGFNMAWTPFFLKKGNDNDAPILFSKISTYFLGIYGLVAIILSLYIGEIVRFDFGTYSLIGEAFWSSTKIVPVIFLAYFFFGLYVLQLPAVYIPEKTKWVPAFRALGALTNVSLNILIIPHYGVLGAAWATVFAQASMALFIFMKTRNSYKIPFRIISILTPLVFIFGAINISEKIFIIKAGYIIMYVLIWYFVVVNKNERKSITQLFS